MQYSNPTMLHAQTCCMHQSKPLLCLNLFKTSISGSHAFMNMQTFRFIIDFGVFSLASQFFPAPFVFFPGFCNNFFPPKTNNLLFARANVAVSVFWLQHALQYLRETIAGHRPRSIVDTQIFRQMFFFLVLLALSGCYSLVGTYFSERFTFACINCISMWIFGE